MVKQGWQRFTDVWVNQTKLGEQFGLSAIDMGEKLKELRLRGEDGKPTAHALAAGYCISTPLKDGTPFLLWDRQSIGELMRAYGYPKLSLQEIKARELAEIWVLLSSQWHEAVYGAEEELLIEEAEDIQKEARRAGLIQRINALLHEQNFDGELMT